jgi:hypothetical protein
LLPRHTLGSDDGFISSSKGRNFGIIHQPAWQVLGGAQSNTS